MQAAAAPQALGKHCRQLGVGQIEPGQGAILQIYISLKGAVAQTQWHRHGLAHQVQRFNDNHPAGHLNQPAQPMTPCRAMLRGPIFQIMAIQGKTRTGW